MGVTNREHVGRVLELLAAGLEPYLESTVAKLVPGVAWPTVLERKDAAEGQSSRTYSSTDVQAQLRMLTERLGVLGFPFDLSRNAQSFASELRQIRNGWAHNATFSDADVDRAMDTTVRLLEAVGVTTQAADAVAVRKEFHSGLVTPADDSESEAPVSGDNGEAAPVSDSDSDSDSDSVLSFESMDVLSYAMAHNRNRLISRITLSNHGGPIEGASLHASVRGLTEVLSQPWVKYLDVPDQQDLVMAEAELVVEPAILFQVQDRQPGTIHLELRQGARVLAHAVKPIEILAPQHWVGREGLVYLESLAAFVQPNHPEIATLCSEVSDFLLEKTGSGSLQGYQAGPERADEIAAAVFSAMRSRDIRYSEPPASWGQGAQKVRTAEEVLVGRLGTCLDTTLVMAAALEYVGIRPLLWLVEGHIFLGYWREEVASTEPALQHPEQLINFIDLGLIALIETTKVTSPDTFTKAQLHDLPYARYLTGDLGALLGVVDVYACRYAGILPIPARVQLVSGDVAVHEYKPLEWRIPLRPLNPTDPVAGSGGREELQRGRPEAPARINQWKNSLLDLSLRNRLINFTRTARFPLAVPDAVVDRFEDMINQGTSLTLLPSDKVSAMQQQSGVRFGRDLPQGQLADIMINQKSVFADVTEAAYSARMQSLAHKAKTQIEETGANNLYLAIGTLLWSIEGRELRSPLILVPARLTPVSRQGYYRVSLDDSGTSTPNYCLLEKLRQVRGLSIPGLAELVEDDSGIDVEAAFKAVREAVAQKGLPFRVEPTVDLSILQFAKFRLWKDLDEEWETLSTNPLVNHLIHRPTEPYFDAVALPEQLDLDELAARCPIPADSSQLEAIASAISGQTFVLEGPPGTGKSQTITNLLTRAIADGKRVLFVAEKRAALDVVQKRLDEVGMGPFSLDLHDKGSKLTAVRAQIKQALDHSVDPDSQGLEAARIDLNSARRRLIRYATSLHQENLVRLSMYTARTQDLASGSDVDPLTIPTSFVHSEKAGQLEDLRRVFAELPDFAGPASPGPQHPWAFIDDPLTREIEIAANQAAVDFQAAITTLQAPDSLMEVLMAAKLPSELETFAHILGGRRVSIETLDEASTDMWQTAIQSLGIQVAAFSAAAHPGLDKVTPDALNLPLPDIHAAAQQAAASGFFGRKKRILAVREQLASVIRPGVEIHHKELAAVTGALVQVQGAARGITGGAATIPGIELPAGWNPLTVPGQQFLRHQIEWLKWTANLVKLQGDDAPVSFRARMRSFLRSGLGVDPQTVADIAAVAQKGNALLAVSLVTDEQFVRWVGDGGFLAAWDQTRAPRDLGAASSLHRWLAFLQCLEPLRAAGLPDARTQLKLGQISAYDAPRSFEQGIAQASIKERETTTGLGDFEPRVHEKTIERFTDRADAVRGHLTTALAGEVLNARPFSPSVTVGQMGELQRQLNRQRGGMGVRQLMTTYGDLITQIMPCILVSPDSVARFFPAKAGLFDLVVFDEASQIRVADAVGAMGRGNATVVVGDSKQMPPTTFAETTPDSEDETELIVGAIEDEESILSECVQARVPRQWLSWHYRSQDESLIAFSNQQYYDSKLASFPAPVHGAASPAVDGHGISFVRVQGQFIRTGKGKELRTNPIEAQAVVTEIRKRFSASPHVMPSIGVVTFNMQQRSHIEALLHATNDSRISLALDDSEGLFVKNLENVQGDERDVILFSTGFSKNDGGYLPLNFGPLNRSGGERRLNVAITRARRQVIVFSSFDPSELRGEETSSVGIKHLRSYLELAAKGNSAMPFNGRRKPAIDRHREQIASALRDRGLAVKTDVGLSDFKVDISVSLADNPGRPVMAVLLDTPAWASRRTAGDRDGLPANVLKKMLRWPAVERVWLPEWIKDADQVADRLEETARRAAEARPEQRSREPLVQLNFLTSLPDREDQGAATIGGADWQAEGLAHPVPGSDQEELVPTASIRGRSEESDSFRHVAAYQPWPLRLTGSIDVLNTLHDSSSRSAVRTVIRHVVEAEGPVHIERMAKLVCAAFGLNKVSADRANSVVNVMDLSLTHVDSESFVWPESLDPATWRSHRTNGPEAERRMEHVSRIEIGNAMVHVSRLTGGIGREELKRETIREFGGRRLTPGIVARLENSLKDAVQAGKLQVDEYGIVRISP